MHFRSLAHNSRIDAVLIAFILCYNTGADLIVCAFFFVNNYLLINSFCYC